MTSRTNITGVMVVEAALQAFVLVVGYTVGTPVPGELQAPLSVVAMGLALYYLPEDFPARRKPPCDPTKPA